MKELFYYDGEYYEASDGIVDLEDRGHQLGDGIFDVIRIYKGRYFALDQHAERLSNEMREMIIPMVDPDEDMFDVLWELLDRSGVQEGSLYIQLTRTSARRQLHYPGQLFPHMMMCIRENPIDRQTQETGIAASLEEDIRWLRCDLLTLNLLGNVMAREKASRKRCKEAILYRKETNLITEGSASNFFILREGILWTHPANNLILNGITRQFIMKELAPKCGLAVVEKAFTPDFAAGADEAFICGTDVEITPVVTLDRKPIGNGQVGPETKKLMAAYYDLVMEDIKKPLPAKEPPPMSFN